MTALQIVGVVLVAVFLGVVVWVMALDLGWRVTAVVWACVLGFVGAALLAVGEVTP